MAHSKPRGSVLGIHKYQLAVRNQTRMALLQAIKTLEIQHPESRWTSIQLCREAGLASPVALKKPWNKDIIELLAHHNAKVSQVRLSEVHIQELPSHLATQKITSKSIAKLRTELAKRDAELLAMEKENQLLRKQLHRQEKLRQLVQKKV
jgi:hypothetical protein